MSKFILDINILQKRVFQILIFLLPTQLAYHFWPNWSFVFGIRVDYLSPTIYLTDILIILLFVTEFIKKQNAFKELLKIKNIWVIILPILFVLINILSSQNYWVAVVKWIKFIESLLLVYFVRNNRLIGFREWIIVPLQYSLILFSLVGLLQFINGRTFSKAFYFLGERSFSVSSPGIALVRLFGRDHLRMYSTFPHPNSLAGYFSISAFILLVAVNKNLKFSKALMISLLFSMIAILFSFSFSSYFSILIILLLFLLFWRHKKYFEIIYFLILGLILLSILLPLVSKLLLKTPNFFPENIYNRLVLAQSSGQMLASRILSGVGLNNFIIALTRYLTYPRVSWLLQPVHNIFLLIVCELGMVGLLAILFIINRIYLKLKTKNNYLAKALMIIIFFVVLTGCADHYWFTIQQNILLLSIILGVIFNKNIFKNKI